MALSVQEVEQRAGKPTKVRRRKGKQCSAVVRETVSQQWARIAIPLPSTDQPNRSIVEKPEVPTTDIDEIKNDALRAYHRKQAELEVQQAQESKHPLLIIKEQVEANNRRGYPYISLEDAYAGYMMWLKREEEEELEEWRERREHEAAMRLRQDEDRRAAIRQAEIEASQQRINYQSFPMGRWHEREDDLDDGWW